MIFPRNTVIAAISAMAASMPLRQVAGFSTTATRKTAFVGPTKNGMMVSRRTHGVSSRSSGGITSTSTGLAMNLFSDIFSGGGGSYSTKIDYTTLDFPGNELGEAAEQGKVIVTSPREPNLKAATFAGGCFWGLELAYQRVPGVVYTATGYAQGDEENPTYDQVCAGATKHTEAVIVYYDPKECSYEQLLDTFFERVDPTTANGQGNDRGPQYRTGVYYHSPEQEEIAKARFEKEKGNYRRPIASECMDAKPFWPAEKYHQQYLEKGGRFSAPQDASKGATETIRCYG